MVSKILLADDSITIQKVVNLTFADEGFEVVAVSNGEMAARRLEEVNPDLVLADIFMPGKNGYELCEAIKTNSKFRNVPVVLLVGAFEPFDQVEARRVQADAHLTKPFESRTLVETVRRLLGNTDRLHTGPLVAAAPAHQESSASVEEQNSWVSTALVDPPATLEFESASGQWRPADMPVDEPAAPPPIAETMPLDPGQHAGEASSDLQSNGIPSSGSEIENEVQFLERPTGELVSPPGGAESPEQTVSPEDQRVTAPDSSFEVQTPAVIEHAEHPPLEIEAQALTVDGPPANGFDQQQMVVDFEESLPSTSEGEANASMLYANTSGVEFDGEEESGSNEWQMEDVQTASKEWRAANKVSLNTTKLEMPDLPEYDRASLDANGEDATVFSFSEAPITESSSVFTAEEPLGDVLFDNGDSEPLTHSSVSASPLEESAMTQFSLDLSPDEASTVDQVSASHSRRITGELVTSELPMAGQNIVESVARDFVAQDVFEPLAEAPEQWIDREQTVTADESVSGDSSPSDSVSYDWTSPGAVIHSTGRLDSTVMPVEFSESSEEPLGEEDPIQPAAPDATLDEPVNWEAEQMRFSAIDIEASPVEEGDALVQPFHASQRERGFEVSAAILDDPASGLNENGHREASEMPLPPIELSPMLIDEIVRRVVAQIADSVVREIAWEIVPDCVERIVEQQTRDALAKR